ncbi:unnamed protein product, partial [Amoebophrya sp. A120]
PDSADDGQNAASGKVFSAKALKRMKAKLRKQTEASVLAAHGLPLKPNAKGGSGQKGGGKTGRNQSTPCNTVTKP